MKNKILAACVSASVLLGASAAIAVPASAGPAKLRCPSGEHFSHQQNTCVPNGGHRLRR
jgi:hypothetical protein